MAARRPESAMEAGPVAATPGRAGRGRRLVVAAGAVGIVVGLLFLPSVRHGFVNWDDSSLVVYTDAYRGFGLAQLRWMASTTLLGHYAPVTWLSFALDYRLWGEGRTGFHLTNVLLHGLNAALVVLVGRRLLGRATAWPSEALAAGAVAAGLVFGLHPLRVEAVSWITGRRDLLSAFWVLVALAAYLQATEAPATRRRRWLLASVVAFGVALLAKAVVMAVPIVLIALDVYPLRRLPADPRRWATAAAWRIWLEKLPFLGLAGVVAAVSYWSAGRGAGIVILDRDTWLGLVAGTLWFHLDKTALPIGLSPLYELPTRIDPWVGAPARAGVGVVVVSGALVALRRVWPAALVAWFAYLALLAPTCGIAHSGPQLTADRYGYLPGIGIALVAGGGVAALWLRRAWLALGAASLLLVSVALITIRQEAIWRDPGRLWGHAVAVTPECATCRMNLGNWLEGRQRPLEAIEQYAAALALRPERVGVHANVGLALERLGRPADAVSHYERVLAVQPGNLAVRVSLASVLVRLDRRGDAVARLSEAVRFQTASSLVDQFRTQAGAQPAAVVPRVGLVQAYLASGQGAPGVAELNELRRLDAALAALVASGLAP
jgi:hypothetical protein